MAELVCIAAWSNAVHRPPRGRCVAARPLTARVRSLYVQRRWPSSTSTVRREDAMSRFRGSTRVRCPPFALTVAALLTLSVALDTRSRAYAAAASAPVSKAARAKAMRDHRAMPLAFVANAGQSDARARYVAQGGGYGFFFTERGVMLTFSAPTAFGAEAGLGWLVASSFSATRFSRRRLGVALALSFRGREPASAASWPPNARPGPSATSALGAARRSRGWRRTGS